MGGRRNTGPPTLIPGGGRSFPAVTLDVETWDQRYPFRSWIDGRNNDPSRRSDESGAWELRYSPAVTRVNYEGMEHWVVVFVPKPYTIP